MKKRREKLPALQMAYRDWKEGKKFQAQACLDWGVDERELRDYANFVEGVPGNGRKPGFLCVLDDSYTKYVQSGGDHPISFYIAKEAPFWGLPHRPIVEAYDVDPTFWPTGYNRT